MRIDIITAVPEILDSPLNHSIVKRAKEKKLVEIFIHNLRDYADNKYRQIDDYQYGGGSGMVMMVEPIFKLIKKLTDERKYDEIIYTSPDGEQFNQKTANTFSLKENLIILCGHYKGVDQRVRDNLITKEITIGDFVMTGGELAAAVFVDSIVRLIPGAISDETSALSDSFQDNLLAPPIYTRPAEFNGWKVPEVLLSGNFKNIDEWRIEKAIENTRNNRPELLND